jgi:hypothetical protein
VKSLVLILSLVLSACSPWDRYVNCPKLEWAPYKFNDKVTIVSGFYEGQQGRIVSQAWYYNSSSCNTLSFMVKLDNLGKEVNIEQINLASDSKECKSKISCPLKK